MAERAFIHLHNEAVTHLLSTASFFREVDRTNMDHPDTGIVRALPNPTDMHIVTISPEGYDKGDENSWIVAEAHPDGTPGTNRYLMSMEDFEKTYGFHAQAPNNVPGHA